MFDPATAPPSDETVARLAGFAGAPFTATEAAAVGITRTQLAQLKAYDMVVSPFRGLWLDACTRMDLEMRTRCLARLAAPHTVVTDQAAAWLWGVDTYNLSELSGDLPLDVFVLRGRKRVTRQETRGGERDLQPRDWVELGGVKVTTPLRTALDLACRLGRYPGIAAVDALARMHALPRDHMQRELLRFRRRRGVVQARELVHLVDARSESTGESMTRLVIHDEGLEPPEPQVWVDGEQGTRIRLDLAYPSLMIAVEYDGEEFHSSDGDRENDRRRRTWLEKQGWVVIVVTKGDLSQTGRQPWITQLEAAIRARSALL
jgi:hypothetical protein